MARPSWRGLPVPAAVLSLAAGLFVGGCSFGLPEDDRTRPEDPASFIELIREDVRTGEWQSILSSSDPAAYENRVVRAAIPEVQFVAELFGLDREDNLIRTGPVVVWEDFERIDSIVVASAGDTIPPVNFAGTAFLEMGETREIDALVTLVQGRFVLSLPAD